MALLMGHGPLRMHLYIMGVVNRGRNLLTHLVSVYRSYGTSIQVCTEEPEAVVDSWWARWYLSGLCLAFSRTKNPNEQLGYLSRFGLNAATRAALPDRCVDRQTEHAKRGCLFYESEE